MSLIDRARNILTDPRAEWPRIAAEPATGAGVFTGYAMILALLPVIGSVIGSFLVSGQLAAMGLGTGMNFIIGSAVLGYVSSLIVLFLMALIVEALAPSFGGRRSRVEAIKWLAYASTPYWVAGLFGFVPHLGWLILLVGLGYAIYLLYLGATPVMGVVEPKAGGFTAAVAVIWVVLGFVAGLVIAALLVATLFHPVVPGGF